MSPDKLIYMANQIAAFFESQPGDGGSRDVAGHINDFWEPRMRQQFLDLAETDAPGLHPLVRDAIPHIRRPAPA